MPDLSPNFKPSILRFDQPMIIAKNRHLCEFIPVELSYASGGYAAGTVLARNTTSLKFQAYNPSGSSGTDTAVAVLFQPMKAEDFPSTTGTAGSVALVRGTLYQDQLATLDAGAITDLNGRTYVDAAGTNLFQF